MNNLKIKLFMLISIVFLAVISISSPAGASKLILNVKTGTEYSHQLKFGLLKFDIIPQMAFWVEDENGKFITNIYITEKSAKSKWGIPGVNRPAALPIWSHNQGILYSTKLYMPDPKHPLPDAVTGATPKISFTREWVVPLDLASGKYKINAEINSSYDYNETYKKGLPADSSNYNDVNGQPSVLYQGEIILDKNDMKINLIPVGHGNPLGKNGEITADMTGITTALKIIDSVDVEFVP